MLHLKIITPSRIAMEQDITSVTAPAASGEITVLRSHMNLFTLLKEGIVKIKSKDKEDYLAIGGGYLETDGEGVNILVSKAYGQDEIDEKLTQEAIENAKRILSQTKDMKQRQEAISLLRRSVIDLNLLKRRKRTP